MTTSDKNNRVYLCGEIASEAEFSHEVYGESFYEMKLSVKRLSGQTDVLPITVSERLLNAEETGVGAAVAVTGQFRSYNKLVNGKSKLMLTVFVRELVKADENRNPNEIFLCGYVCKPPVYRTTPFNREIADILIAVNRSYNKSDYIPCIAWGRNARFTQNLAVGEKIAVFGRIQSREYQKKYSETDIRKMVAYEVSISRLAASGEEDEYEEDANGFFESEQTGGEKDYGRFDRV